MDRLYFRVGVILSLLISSSSAFTKENVNILSWWGYLHPNTVKEVEDTCGVNISVDEYYSNTEFLRRWDRKPKRYDVVIYSNTIFNIVQKDIKTTFKAKPAPVAYHPAIKEKASFLNLSSNTKLFLISLTGFLWNKDKMSLTDKDSFSSMLTNAKDGIIIILDDPVEGSDLLNKFKLESIKSTKRKSKILIANNLDNLTIRKDFAFAYLWSGSAFEKLQMNKSLDFVVHRDLSHLTADLISALTQRKATLCVYEAMASEKFLTKLQDKTFYFSPYGKSNTENKAFQAFYKRFFTSVEDLKWLNLPPVERFYKLNEEWKRLKIDINQK